MNTEAPSEARKHIFDGAVFSERWSVPSSSSIRGLPPGPKSHTRDGGVRLGGGTRQGLACTESVSDSHDIHVV